MYHPHYEYKIPKEYIRYAIANKWSYDPHKYDFVSTLAHEFKGENEVLGFSALKDAIHFDDKETALEVFANQPAWVHEKCEVIAFEKRYGNCYLIRGGKIDD